MSLTQLLISILTIHLLALISPGPDFFVVMNAALAERKKGVMAALGVTAAIAVHISLWIFGLSSILVKFPAFLTALKFMGAGYLFYLGINLILDFWKQASADLDVKSENSGLKNPLAAGFITNVFNPKAWLYFASLFSQFDLSRLSFSVSAGLAVAITLLSFAWFASLAFSISGRGLRVFYSNHIGKVHLVLGCLLIGVGIKSLG